MLSFVTSILRKNAKYLYGRRYHQSHYKALLREHIPTVCLSRLSNGIVVATESRHSPTATVGLFYDSGPRYEHMFESGLMHFFEHIAFKSTQQRAKDVLQSHLSASGARFRHHITREMTSFYFEGLVEKVPDAFDILVDCLYNNSFDENELMVQRCNVHQEMLDYDEKPHKYVYDYLHTTAYQDTPLAQTVMGYSSNLVNFTPNVICTYLDRMFAPQRTVLCAVGGISHEQIRGLADHYLGCYLNCDCPDVRTYRYTGSEVRARDDSQTKSHVCIGFEAPNFCSDDKVVMDVAASVIGGWDRSQYRGRDHCNLLARHVSTDHLCDAYRFFYFTYKDTGLWGTHFAGASLDLEDMLYNVQNSYMELCVTITNGEVERGKRELYARLVQRNACTETACQDIARSLLFKGCTDHIAEQLEEISQVGT